MSKIDKPNFPTDKEMMIDIRNSIKGELGKDLLKGYVRNTDRAKDLEKKIAELESIDLKQFEDKELKKEFETGLVQIKKDLKEMKEEYGYSGMKPQKGDSFAPDDEGDKKILELIKESDSLTDKYGVPSAVKMEETIDEFGDNVKANIKKELENDISIKQEWKKNYPDKDINEYINHYVEKIPMMMEEVHKYIGSAYQGRIRELTKYFTTSILRTATKPPIANPEKEKRDAVIRKRAFRYGQEGRKFDWIVKTINESYTELKPVTIRDIIGKKKK